MPSHNYIYIPTREMWPAESVNSRIAPVRTGVGTMDANKWLDQNRPVEQMTWAPGLPPVIRDRLVLEGGWIDRLGAACFNLYAPPTIVPGDAAKADPWVYHVRLLYPNEADHILDWLAQRVQRPQEKINHALVLGGQLGIGKDMLLDPARHAVGAWNFQEVSPVQLLGRFNGFLKSVILRISEARDLGEFDRFRFYDHMKPFAAAPPDVLRVDEKHRREYSVLNVCGIIITTNHKTDGIFLPADDRRHFVAWSDKTKDDVEFQGDYFRDLDNWYKAGGYEHVAAFLLQRDISGFNAKAPPPTTAAFWAIVDASRPSEAPELADTLDRLGNPPAVTLALLVDNADDEFAFWLRDRRNRPNIPRRLEQVGYVPVRNTDAADGLWKIWGKRQAVYARQTLTIRDQLEAVKGLRDSQCDQSGQ